MARGELRLTVQAGRAGSPDLSARSHATPRFPSDRQLGWRLYLSGTGAAAVCEVGAVRRVMLPMFMPSPLLRRRTLELAREYRSIGRQCYVLPDTVATSVDAIRDYLDGTRARGRPPPADAIDSADGDVGGRELQQQTRRRAGGDVVTPGSGRLRGRRSVLFEFHRMSSYRYVRNISVNRTVRIGQNAVQPMKHR